MVVELTVYFSCVNFITFALADCCVAFADDFKLCVCYPRINVDQRMQASVRLQDASHSTVTALLPLVHQIATGLNQNYPIHRTVSMAVDFSKAFDTVNHTILLSDINNTNMEHNTVRWLTTYLRGRTAICRYNNTSSKSYVIHTGVPQGSVLSPLLFNLCV